MSVDAVVSSVVVMPKEDVKDHLGNTGRDPRHERPSPRRRESVDVESDEHHPLMNSYGQLIGLNINITA